MYYPSVEFDPWHASAALTVANRRPLGGGWWRWEAWPAVVVIDARGLGTTQARELVHVLSAADRPP
jgi:hypothetical protein